MERADPTAEDGRVKGVAPSLRGKLESEKPLALVDNAATVMGRKGVDRSEDTRKKYNTEYSFGIADTGARAEARNEATEDANEVSHELKSTGHFELPINKACIPR